VKPAINREYTPKFNPHGYIRHLDLGQQNMAKKFYVVWAGRETGVFNDWAYTKKLVDKFPQAKYKSFPTQQEAEQAFAAGNHSTAGKNTTPKSSKTNPAKSSPALSPANNQLDVHIYCDGACDPNPGEAGSGVAVYQNTKLTQLWYGLYNPQGTNNTAELNALYQSLLIARDELAQGQSVQILCDSQYAINCVTNWAFDWKSKGWKKKNGEIKNLAIIQQAHETYCLMENQITISHVRAHMGIEGNELADRMAVLGRVRQDTDFCRYSDELNIEQILSFQTG